MDETDETDERDESGQFFHEFFHGRMGKQPFVTWGICIRDRVIPRPNKKRGAPSKKQGAPFDAHFPRETKEAPFGTSSADRGIHTLFATAMFRLSPEASAVSARLIVLYRPQVVHANPTAWDTRPVARRLQHRHAGAVLQASVGVRMCLGVGG